MTHSVSLRARTVADHDMLYRVFTELDTWEERSGAPPRPVPYEEFVARLSAGDYDGDVHFVIAVEDRGVGRCTLLDTDPLARTAEIGIALLPEARGCGYGSAAIAQLVEFAFDRQNLRRLHLSVLASNAAAIASYAKAGFLEEGRRREHYWVRGAYEDEVLMGLLRSAWTGSAAVARCEDA
jgi:RimJ/RimL family protein N-acetyltransferase